MSDSKGYYAAETISFGMGALAVAAVLICALTQARGCDAKLQEEKTARCKAVIEAKADPVTINSACRGN